MHFTAVIEWNSIHSGSVCNGRQYISKIHTLHIHTHARARSWCTARTCHVTNREKYGCHERCGIFIKKWDSELKREEEEEREP